MCRGAKLPFSAGMQANRLDSTRRARDLARILDSAFRIPGTRLRFGLDPILGLVPGLGDAVGGGFGLYLLFQAYRAGAPAIVMFRMFANIAADVVIGAVPLLGDLLDAGYKANLRNLSLLERYLERPQQATRRSLIFFVILVSVLLLILAGAVWLTIAAVRAVF